MQSFSVALESNTSQNATNSGRSELSLASVELGIETRWDGKKKHPSGKSKQVENFSKNLELNLESLV